MRPFGIDAHTRHAGTAKHPCPPILRRPACHGREPKAKYHNDRARSQRPMRSRHRCQSDTYTVWSMRLSLATATELPRCVTSSECIGGAA
jgi:hypothetical protein